MIRGEAPSGKRVRRLDAPSVLAWFQAALEEARVASRPAETGAAALGGPVPALAKLFEAAHQLSLHTPKTPAALRKLLAEHAGVGGEDNVLVDSRSVRVLTADGEKKEAWFFFDDEAKSRAPAGLLDESETAPPTEGPWDPFAQVKAPKPPKAASPPKEPKAPKSAREPASSGPKPSQRAKASAAATAAANKHEAAWRDAVGGRGERDARAYAPAERFAEGELIHHPKFGVGVVTRAEITKIEAIFSGAPRILVHGARS